MIKLLLFAIFAFLVYTVVSTVLRLFRSPQGPSSSHPPSRESGESMVKDPVCGTYLPQGEAISLRRGGVEHYFCSTECRDRFKQER